MAKLLLEVTERVCQNISLKYKTKQLCEIKKKDKMPIEMQKKPFVYVY